jgi:hypothetical protein
MPSVTASCPSNPTSASPAGAVHTIPTNPLFELHLRLEPCPTKPSRPAAACRLLPWTSAPYSTRGFEGPPTAGFACPLRSALRVWPPSRRFPPFEPLPALFRAGGAHGIHPSEHSPPKRYPGVATRVHPHTVSPGVLPAAEASGRPAWPPFLGFGPPRSPWRPVMCLSYRPLAAPLGFCLPGPAGKRLVRDSARPPLTRFACRGPDGPARRRLRVSISAHLASSAVTRWTHAADKTTLVGFPHLPRSHAFV